MFSANHQKFMEMDALSISNTPFFFITDFLMNHVEIFADTEIEEKGLIIDFQNFSNAENRQASDKKMSLESFPETLKEFKKGFEYIQKNIRVGNSYLANYTRKTEIKTNFSLEEIFYHSGAKYKVLYPDFFVFFSPETFVKTEKNTIFTYPMKGTIDASLANAAEILLNDVKEKAEHYTVADLLRNDLSMIADDVAVEKLMYLDFIRTRQKNLLAMSSEISGKIKREYRGKIGSLMQKLLPAGSILGAPKPKTLEIILEAEGFDRGYYTGVCGYFDGENLDSCVMIRFIENEGGKMYFKSGGGITHMSRAEDEYQEMKNKIYVPVY